MRVTGDSSFLFITGMVRALENRLLGRGNIEAMLRAESGDDAVNILKGTRYSALPVLNMEPFSADMLIKKVRGELFDFIDRYSMDTGAGCIFRLDYDYHNMKILLRRKIFSDGEGDLLSDLGTMSIESMTEIFEHEDYSSLPVFMRKAVSAAIEKYFSLKKTYIINPVFDRSLFAQLLDAAGSTGSALICNYIRRKIDAVNIMSLLRVKGKSGVEDYADYLFFDGGFIAAEMFRVGVKEPLKTLLEIAAKNDLHGVTAALSEKSNMLYAVERECRAMMMRELEAADFMITGIEPLFAYGSRADNELKNIGMILSSKFPEFNSGIAETMLIRGGE